MEISKNHLNKIDAPRVGDKTYENADEDWMAVQNNRRRKNQTSDGTRLEAHIYEMRVFSGWRLGNNAEIRRKWRVSSGI